MNSGEEQAGVSDDTGAIRLLFLGCFTSISQDWLSLSEVVRAPETEHIHRFR